MHTVTKLEAFGKSDIGNVRDNNEDAFCLLLEYGFFALADGMGGHNAGEIAAHETIAFLCRSVEELILGLDGPITTPRLKRDLADMLKHCNSYVHHIATKNLTLEGMGTTICVALVFGETLIHAHIGDSRIYLFRENTLLQLTRDHSLVNKIIDEKNISEEAARSSVSGSVITRSVGTNPQVVPEIEAIDLLPGDQILLCSDGLSDSVSDDDIAKKLSTPLSLEEKTNELIELAKSNGGSDNITIIMVKNGNLP